MGDYCDGEQFQEHPLFKEDPCALQIRIYYDDVEVCNALGSKTKKHKLGKLDKVKLTVNVHNIYTGLFYYSLGNIQPKYRSVCHAIQLLAVVRTALIEKYGINEILKPFMEDLKRLGRVCHNTCLITNVLIIVFIGFRCTLFNWWKSGTFSRNTCFVFCR